MISFKDEVQRVAPKGTTRIVFKTEKNIVLNWKNGKIYVSGETAPKHRNHPLWWGGVEVPDAYLETYENITLLGCEVNGIVFTATNESVYHEVGRGGDDEEEEGYLLEYLLYYWPTKSPKMSQSSNLKCDLTDERFLDGMVGMYYNNKCGYYATLQKLVDYYSNNHFGIHKLDRSIDTLKKGFEMARRGYNLSYDGLNFEVDA